MRVLRFLCLVVAGGLSIHSGRAVAQRRTTLAVDATLGAGFGKGGEFYDRQLRGARIAASLRRSGSTRVGFFPVSHLGVIVGARWIVAPRYRGDRLSVLPWSLGFRVR
jgi:hypothetical protein